MTEKVGIRRLPTDEPGLDTLLARQHKRGDKNKG